MQRGKTSQCESFRSQQINLYPFLKGELSDRKGLSQIACFETELL